MKQEVIVSILDKFHQEKDEGNRIVMISFPDLYSFLSEEEVGLVERVRGVNPREYGFQGEYFGEEPVPELKPISGVGVKTQYLPRKVHSAFVKMRGDFREKIGLDLVCCSGYRSRAYQVVAFLSNLKLNDFDLETTFRIVALPGYSEHNLAEETALDLQGADYDPDIGFETTEQYRWLKKNAEGYRFYESYPEDNNLGMDWEPWHWRYRLD